MTPETLKSWRARLGFTQASAAEALGVPVGTYRDWEQGRWAETLPRYLALACAALARKIKPLE